MPLFTTSFAPPAALTGLTISADVASSSVALEWDATALGADFDRYAVYRSLDGVTWEEIASISVEGESAYVDAYAPAGRLLHYSVSVWNTTGFESEPVGGTTELAVTTWYLVTPGDSALTFALAVTTGYDDTMPVEDEEFVALGRDRKIVLWGETLGAEGSIEVSLSRDDAHLHELIAAVLRLEREFIILKSPFGDVYRVRLRSVRRRRGTAGRQTVMLPFVEVA